jgi:hypothetical protein
VIVMAACAVLVYAQDPDDMPADLVVLAYTGMELAAVSAVLVVLSEVFGAGSAGVEA